MKKILLLAIAAFIGFGVSAQSVILKIGTDGYVTIDGANYVRGYLGSAYTVSGIDSFLQININSNTPRPFYYAAKCNVYKDGDNGNVAFASMAALHTWMNSHFEFADTSTSSGSSLDTTHGYTWTGPNTFTGTPQTFSINGGASTVSPAVQLVNTTAATSGSKTQLPPYVYYKGHKWNGSTSLDMQFRIGSTYGTGNTTTQLLNLDYSIDGGSTWTNALQTSNQDLIIKGGATVTGGILNLQSASGGDALLASAGNIHLSPAFAIKYEVGGTTNKTSGTLTLVSGQATVSTTSVNTGDQIVLIGTTPSGTVGTYFQTIVDGTSFTISSYVTVGGVATLNTLDLSTLMYTIIKH